VARTEKIAVLDSTLLVMFSLPLAVLWFSRSDIQRAGGWLVAEVGVILLRDNWNHEKKEEIEAAWLVAMGNTGTM
jgi:hypothetical protein